MNGVEIVIFATGLIELLDSAPARWLGRGVKRDVKRIFRKKSNDSKFSKPEDEAPAGGKDLVILRRNFERNSSKYFRT